MEERLIRKFHGIPALQSTKVKKADDQKKTTKFIKHILLAI